MEDKFVLVACEESQRVCAEFRKLGFIAFSCDIKPESGGHPEWHIQQNVIPLLDGYCLFRTNDGKAHHIPGKWDLIIAHPPCTRLCNSGQRWRFWGSDEQRKQKERETVDAIDFFMTFANLKNCDHIGIENPIGIMSTIYRKPDCIYNPYDFAGETDCKKTCLWLWGLPPLKPTQLLPPEQRTQNVWKAHFNGKSYSWNSPETARLRSQTPVGVARAMAAQWSEVLKGEKALIKEKLIVNIRFGFEEAPAETDLKKLTSKIAFNYLINCSPGPIAWIEVTAENKETKETGVYRHPFMKGEKDNV